MPNSCKQKAGPFYGIVGVITLLLITIITFIPIFLIGIFKLVPNQKWRMQCAKGIDQMVSLWTGLTASYVKRFCKIHWNISGNPQFDRKQWYLVIANHQSWLDIVILQHFFHDKIPVLKFFIKDQLKWVPLFNFAWWVMGCPFMKRYSKEYLEKHPQKKGQDLKAAQKALKLFKSYPSSIISFVEGTRFTPQKQLQQQSPYLHLLKPKAGGISQVIGGMGHQLQSILDVTIVYNNPNHSIWKMLCRYAQSVNVNVRLIPIPQLYTSGDSSFEDSYTQNTFRAWLNDQWMFKDTLIDKLKA